MGHAIDIASWSRRRQYLQFIAFDKPHFSLTAEVDVTALVEASRDGGVSFTLGTLHAAMLAANAVEALRLRLRGDGVWCHANVGVGSTVARAEDPYGIGAFPWEADFARFQAHGRDELARVRSSPVQLDEGGGDDAWLHVTVLPWVRFTAYANALRRDDSVPKIAFGRRTLAGGRWQMPVAVEVHHALVHGVDVGAFFAGLQERLSGPWPARL